jgi:hypothetical protein
MSDAWRGALYDNAVFEISPNNKCGFMHIKELAGLPKLKKCLKSLESAPSIILNNISIIIAK